MTGREAPNGDPLDRIEAVLESWGEQDWMPTWRDDGFVPQLLALVAVARAARDLEADVEAITDDGFNLVGHEHILALGAALARLEEPR